MTVGSGSGEMTDCFGENAKNMYGCFGLPGSV